MTEPKYTAYQVDTDRFENFHSLEDAASFFKMNEISLHQKASGYSPTYITGKKINQKWIVFHKSVSKEEIILQLRIVKKEMIFV